MQRDFEVTFVAFAGRERKRLTVPEGENIQDWVESAMAEWLWENYAPEFLNLQETTGDNVPED